MSIADALFLFAVDRGLTVDEVATRLEPEHIAPGRTHAILIDGIDPSLSELAWLCSALETAPSQIIATSI
ncbi:hypothetical protein [Demequina sediminicola]|uniref:hypothetical protein n=1 Tax=Demequina sediminicola TaxID=1095026 RepID=UPI0007803E5F|nr:hypothetical protein [Demequina sediminicola]